MNFVNKAKKHSTVQTEERTRVDSLFVPLQQTPVLPAAAADLPGEV